MKAHRRDVLSPRLRSLASVLIILHLGLLAATLSTAMIDWIVRDRLIDIATPYTAATHLHLGGRAIADATYTTTDWKHRLQYRMPNQEAWQDCDLGIGLGLGGKRRYERYLTTIAEASEREDTATAAMLGEPLIARMMNIIAAEISDPADASISQLDRGSEPYVSARAYFQVRVMASVGEDLTGPLKETLRWQAGVVSKPKLTDTDRVGWAVVYLEEDRLNAKAVRTVATRASGSESAD